MDEHYLNDYVLLLKAKKNFEKEGNNFDFESFLSQYSGKHYNLTKANVDFFIILIDMLLQKYKQKSDNKTRLIKRIINQYPYLAELLLDDLVLMERFLEKEKEVFLSSDNF